MVDQNVPVNVQIQDKEYRIACPAGEEEELIQSARYLDNKMQEIREGGKIVGTNRIAVMAGLNIAHELLKQSGQSTVDEATEHKIRSLQGKIEAALQGLKQMEL